MKTVHMTRPAARLGFARVVVGIAGIIHLTTSLLLLLAPCSYFMVLEHFPPYNRHDAGDPFTKIAWTLPVAAVALAAAVYLTAPRSAAGLAGMEVSDAEVLKIVGTHCVMCHSSNPSHEGFDAAPKGVTLVSIAGIRAHADQIMTQAVNGDAMPLGNETGMTPAERRALGAFLLNK